MVSITVVQAELKFDLDHYNATVEFGQERVPFEFSFSNTGDRTIRITEVRTSCGCTTSELEQKVYQPGESGTINGYFQVGNRQGRQRQHVHVRTDNPEQPEVRLDVTVTIPQVVTIIPRLVRWAVDKVPEPRIVKVTPNSARGVEVLDVTVDSDDFVMEFVEANSGSDSLEIIVAPITTDRANRATVRIATKDANGNERDFFVHAMVR